MFFSPPKYTEVENYYMLNLPYKGHDGAGHAAGMLGPVICSLLFISYHAILQQHTLLHSMYLKVIADMMNNCLTAIGSRHQQP